MLLYANKLTIQKLRAYLARDTHVSRPCSVRITPEIRTYHGRDTLAKKRGSGERKISSVLKKGFYTFACHSKIYLYICHQTAT